MTVVNISAAVMPALPPRRWARNGQYPSAWLASQLAKRVNHLIYTKGKEVFAKSSGIANIPASSGAGPGSTRDRWRGAFHTSTRVTALYAEIVAAAPGSGIDNSYVRVRVLDSSGATIGDAVLNYPGPLAAGDTPARMNHGIVPVRSTTGAIATATSDDDCTLVVTDVGSARVASVTLWEVPLSPDTGSGYIDPNVGVMSPILKSFRSTLAQSIAAQWDVGSRHLSTWCVELDSAPRTIASATATNLIDGTTTGAPTTATPGLYFDLTHCDRTKDTASGVLVNMRVYAKDTTAGNGTVELVDSSGVVHNSLTGFPVAAAWSGTSQVFLPASGGKYDLRFKTSVGTLSVWAVSLYLGE